MGGRSQPFDFFPSAASMMQRAGVRRRWKACDDHASDSQPMAARSVPARAKVLATNAVSGLNTLLTSYSKRRGASDFSFSAKHSISSHDRRTSYAFAFSASEKRKIQNQVFVASLEYAQRLPSDPDQAGASGHVPDPADANTELGEILGAYGVPRGASGAEPQHVVAAKVSLPPRESPPPIDITSLLPPAEAERYADPKNFLLPEQERNSAKTKIKSCVLVSCGEYHQLLDELFIRGMISFQSTAEVVNGLFAVPKTDEIQRLIADMRRTNALFSEPEKTTLVGPDTISKVQVPPGAKLVQATRDLRDFYHRLAMPAKWRPYFAWPSVDVSLIPSAARAGLHGTLFPVLVSLPMGFSHSVRIAQLIHERAMHVTLGLRKQDQILPHNDLRLRPGRILYSVYIDDTWFVMLFDPSDPDSTALRRLLEAYERCLAALGVPDKPSKRVGPIFAGPCDVLGMVVDGGSLFFGMSVERLEALKAATRSLCAREGPVSGRELARVLGKWTWAFLARRPAMAIFAAAYLFVSAFSEKEAVLWTSVKEELTVAVQLAPLLHTALDLTWSSTVWASDASMRAGGVTAKTLTKGPNFFGPNGVRELVQSAQTLPKRLPPFGEDDAAEREPLIQAVLNDPAQWRVIFQRDWQTRGEHINCLKMRAAYLAVRQACLRDASSPQRHLFLCDNTVCVATVAKGRCSSRNLLVRFRPMAALILATGANVTMIYIESARNPSDAPSRASLRSPERHFSKRKHDETTHSIQARAKKRPRP